MSHMTLKTQTGAEARHRPAWASPWLQVKRKEVAADLWPLSVPDTTDFQESFVTSGVFSVTELIQVSRSECLRPRGPVSAGGWSCEEHAHLTCAVLSSTCSDGNRTQLLPGRAARPPGLRPEPGWRRHEEDSP